ncbi:MAG: hypothetical protein JSS02_08185 [Planctomycetes bacterium]|nr:hypothetical protein [Planctomycetota bacterium]
MPQYELWEYDGGHTFFGVPVAEVEYHERVRQLLAEEPQAVRTWTVEATGWDAAMQRLYDHKGWGPYRPIEDELGLPPDPT